MLANIPYVDAMGYKFSLQCIMIKITFTWLYHPDFFTWPGDVGPEEIRA